MPVGSVAVDDTGAVTGTGAARELYDLIEAIQNAANPPIDLTKKDADFDGTLAEWDAAFRPFIVKVKRAWAREATAHARAMASGISGQRPPLIAALTGMSLGGIAASEGDFGLHLRLASEGAVQHVRGYEQTASGAYKFTAGVHPLPALTGNPLAGVFLRDTASSRLLTLGLVYDVTVHGLRLSVDDWTNPDTFASTLYLSGGLGLVTRMFLRIEDDGANHRFGWSSDGENFHEVLVQGRTVLMSGGGDRRGAFVRAYSGFAGLTAFSWDVT